MRSLPGTIAVLSALVLNVTFNTDLEACGRGRHRRSCESCCIVTSCQSCGTVPGWARCIVIHTVSNHGEISKVPSCPPGYVCYCCENGVCVRCDNNCTGSLMCVVPGKPLPICPDFGLESSELKPGGCPESVRLCAMICDPYTHSMRFARPCEPEDGYFALCFLGQPCGSTLAAPPKPNR